MTFGVGPQILTRPIIRRIKKEIFHDFNCESHILLPIFAVSSGYNTKVVDPLRIKKIRFSFGEVQFFHRLKESRIKKFYLFYSFIWTFRTSGTYKIRESKNLRQFLRNFENIFLLKSHSCIKFNVSVHE